MQEYRHKGDQQHDQWRQPEKDDVGPREGCLVRKGLEVVARARHVTGGEELQRKDQHRSTLFPEGLALNTSERKGENETCDQFHTRGTSMMVQEVTHR